MVTSPVHSASAPSAALGDTLTDLGDLVTKEHLHRQPSPSLAGFHGAGTVRPNATAARN